ncbi:unnamed protein product [Darwinula stevensoni]|uniref:Uncharacterized protein n=1 Tax=Darwinula stevensoni TaxID=69355 RepID=A0A7R8XK63_9CRUS|nr:unnamed protein product [Darwinula stevensoni]CAG0895440.1 unnamed protein product [Darwinula stevensoni]
MRGNRRLLALVAIFICIAYTSSAHRRQRNKNWRNKRQDQVTVVYPKKGFFYSTVSSNPQRMKDLISVKDGKPATKFFSPSQGVYYRYDLPSGQNRRKGDRKKGPSKQETQDAVKAILLRLKFNRPAGAQPEPPSTEPLPAVPEMPKNSNVEIPTPPDPMWAVKLPDMKGEPETKPAGFREGNQRPADTTRPKPTFPAFPRPSQGHGSHREANVPAPSGSRPHVASGTRPFHPSFDAVSEPSEPSRPHERPASLVPSLQGLPPPAFQAVPQKELAPVLPVPASPHIHPVPTKSEKVPEVFPLPSIAGTPVKSDSAPARREPLHPASPTTMLKEPLQIIPVPVFSQMPSFPKLQPTVPKEVPEAAPISLAPGITSDPAIPLIPISFPTSAASATGEASFGTHSEVKSAGTFVSSAAGSTGTPTPGQLIIPAAHEPATVHLEGAVNAAALDLSKAQPTPLDQLDAVFLTPDAPVEHQQPPSTKETQHMVFVEPSETPTNQEASQPAIEDLRTVALILGFDVGSIANLDRQSLIDLISKKPRELVIEKATEISQAIAKTATPEPLSTPLTTTKIPPVQDSHVTPMIPQTTRKEEALASGSQSSLPIAPGVSGQEVSHLAAELQPVPLPTEQSSQQEPAHHPELTPEDAAALLFTASLIDQGTPDMPDPAVREIISLIEQTLLQQGNPHAKLILESNPSVQPQQQQSPATLDQTAGTQVAQHQGQTQERLSTLEEAHLQGILSTLRSENHHGLTPQQLEERQLQQALQLLLATSDLVPPEPVPTNPGPQRSFGFGPQNRIPIDETTRLSIFQDANRKLHLQVDKTNGPMPPPTLHREKLVKNSSDPETREELVIQFQGAKIQVNLDGIEAVTADSRNTTSDNSTNLPPPPPRDPSLPLMIISSAEYTRNLLVYYDLIEVMDHLSQGEPASMTNQQLSAMVDASMLTLTPEQKQALELNGAPLHLSHAQLEQMMSHVHDALNTVPLDTQELRTIAGILGHSPQTIEHLSRADLEKLISRDILLMSNEIKKL